jgi:excisionase family DNA binding protein
MEHDFPRDPTPSSASTLLTVAEVARVMRVSKMTVYRLVRSGKLSAVRIGKVLRIPRASMRQFLGEI